MRFEGWEQWDKPHAGSMIGGEWSLVLHTTEGSTIEGAISALDRQNSWPQLMACPNTKRRIQAIDTEFAGKALSNKSGGVETNRENTIQIEIVGFAAESQDWPDEWYDWLGVILRPIMDHHGIIRTGPRFYGQDAGFTLASPDAPQRMSFDEWNAFGGVCGHQHVPENDHWDPGKFDLTHFLKATTTAPPVPEQPEAEGDMAVAENADDPGKWFFVTAGGLCETYPQEAWNAAVSGMPNLGKVGGWVLKQMDDELRGNKPVNIKVA